MFAHLCPHRNGSQRVSLAAALGAKAGAPALVSGGAQSSRPAARGPCPVGVNRSRLQPVSTESRSSRCPGSCWFIASRFLTPSPSSCFTLRYCVLELLFSETCVKRKGSCVLFGSCRWCLCCVGRTKHDAQAYKVLILVYNPQLLNGLGKERKAAVCPSRCQ